LRIKEQETRLTLQQYDAAAADYIDIQYYIRISRKHAYDNERVINRKFKSVP